MKNYRKVANDYFKAVEEQNFKGIMDLFDENCVLYFSDTGVVKGKQEYIKLNHNLSNEESGFQFRANKLHYRFERFKYTQQRNRLVVEGVEYGENLDGFPIKDNKFCSVFEFDEQTRLITRMYVYTDPNFGIN